MLDRHHPLGAGLGFSLAVGIFWRDRCEGVMTFGCPVSNLAVYRYGLRQHEALELRKMFVSDVPPRNAESRALAVVADMIRNHYPQIRILVSYCGADERASAYRAAGWIPQQKHTYVREVLVGGRWYSMRTANRLRITTQATERKSESRQKYVLPLDASVAQLVERSSSNGEATVRSRSGRSDISMATENRPSLPETGSGVVGRGLDSTQA